jgi:hypothetical protein
MPRVRIALVGADDSGWQALLDTGAGLQEVELRRLRQASAAACDAYLFACACSLADAERETVVEAIAVEIRTLAERTGRRCETAGLPVFVVLTQADALARPGESHAAWLERVEEVKTLISEQLRQLLPNAASGFGGVDLHVWAVATRRPGAAKATEPFGVDELFRQAVTAGRRYAAHAVLQRHRLRAVFTLVCLVLVGMFASASAWAWQRGGLLPVKEAERAALGRRLDESRRLRQLQAHGEALLRFSAHMSPAGIDWPGWVADAERLEPELINHAGGAELAGLRRSLAALLGLGGEGEASLALPSATGSQNPLEQVNTAAKQVLARIPVDRVRVLQEPLPGGVPLRVARELELAALANLERFLAPVREDIEKRVLQSGAGKETLDGWKRLLTEWLAEKSDQELASWREAVRLLQRAADQPERDPLRELETFLRRPSQTLAVSRVEVVLPASGAVAGVSLDELQPTATELEVSLGKSPGEVVTHRLKRLPAPGYVFGHGDPGKPTSVVEPGTEVTARLQVQNAMGQKWWLVWSPVDRASAVFGQDVLFRAPRLLAEAQTDPGQAPIAFGIGLRFGEQEPWPALLPR